ncbi:MAG: 1-acyl-sn-glycerol-3-phosphate acyltransferase [Rhizobiales bacterium]|nr:1-acyl-sn-glycerol-3-phosphate acyltransferase [Hyphomicrobiales bacterium]
MTSGQANEETRPGRPRNPAPAPANPPAGGIPSWRSRQLKRAFFALFVRPLILLVLGINMRRRHLLPTRGPGIIVANHNSHLDTLTLMALMPLGRLPEVRPVAAADYFLANRWLRFIALDLLGILPIARGGIVSNPIALCREALDRGELLILFPEGSRGDPERLAEFKKGISLIARSRPDVPITPVFLHGLGKALPKGSFLLVPFFCDAFVGEPIVYRDSGGPDEFMDLLERRFRTLAAEGNFEPWE